MTLTRIDPRSAYRSALDWADGLVAGVRPEQLDGPTPCAEFDVRTLVRHLIATVNKIRAIGEGVSPFAMPHIAPDAPDLPAAFATAVTGMWTVWSDDALLDAEVAVPWGRAPGRAALWGYVNETLVHGWDLAVATGQHAEADPELATTVLDLARRLIPTERGGEVPFGAVVEPAAEAGPTEQLANWSGHRR